MKKKKPSRHFFRILTALFIMFMIVYILLEFGYYESKLSRQSTLTHENIQKFEQDVKDGKPIDLNSYLIEEEVDYSNSVSRAGTAISETVNTFMTEGLSSVAEMLKKLFW